MNAEDLIVSFKRDMARLSRTERRRAEGSLAGAVSDPDSVRAACGSVGTAAGPREQVCVMTGVNDANETFFEVSGRGILSKKRAMDVLKGRIKAGSVVATDRATAYDDVLAELDVAAYDAYGSRDRSEGTINRINAVHSLLGQFKSRFKGVSTKRLSAYLDWFKWCRTFMATDPGSAERTAARQIANGVCKSRIRDIFNVKPHYMDYWVASAA